MTTAKVARAPEWSSSGGWFLVCVYCAWETIALMLSTLYSIAEPIIQERYGVANPQIVTLGQSMQIMGNILGVALFSPLSYVQTPVPHRTVWRESCVLRKVSDFSDVFGRKRVTIFSMLAYSVLNLGTAYAPNLATLVFFMFLSGAAWSTSLSLVPAVFSDLYLHRDDVGQPIALFVVGATVGPALGVALATALVDAGADLKWYFLVTVFVSAACAVPMLFVPESLAPRAPSAAIANGKTGEKAAGLQVLMADHQPARPCTRYYLTRVWVLLATEPIIWITGVYNGFANGVFVLAVAGTITTLTEFKGLSMQEAGPAIMILALGVFLVWFVMPTQTRLYREDKARHGGKALPEARLLLVHDVLWLFPVALVWTAFTGGEGWAKWHQAVTGGMVAFTDSFLYQCLLIYIMEPDLYPEEAASAIAAWLIPCFPVQAAAVHFGVPMFRSLGPAWGFGVLAAFTTGFVVPGFYLIKRYGPQMRRNSPAAKKGFRE
ncbi:polyamine transporter 2 [Colletotrichum sojae]|uniref:Polyamine transporter 2 n=1 Tax=Colletotrichum sojae TaxID=2175907 RepID=A0A8H6IU75_9PEZI|nr:polyamine transporter 2 [Colletotrichum sojae]